MPENENEKDVVYFAKTDFRNQDRLFGIKRKDRRQHMYVVGKTGTGKSAFIHNLIVQDITNGEGLCVVDPHGELVESVIRKIPKSRAQDIIYFNPADTEYPIGFNILDLPNPKYKHLVASGLMGIFTKIWAGVWSARMEYILNNAILALLDTPNTTLLGIPRLLVDKEYRQRIIANVNDPVVKAFWLNEYEEWQDKFRNEAIAPIQNKVGQFLSTAIIRNVVGQSKSTIDIFEIMNQRKIFLINVSKGRIGEDNAALLGAMLITKIQLSAMERVRIPEEKRKDFYLYVDEFQNFATDSFASVLSEARKYRLDLTIAHQYIGQLVTDVSTKVRDAVFGNVGTMVVFRVGAADAEFLENELEPEFTIQDMVNLPNYNIYLKLMVNGVTSRPFSAKTLPPFNLRDEVLTEEEVIAISRKNYSRNLEDVDAEVRAWSSNQPIGEANESGGQGNVPRAGTSASRGFGEAGKQSYDIKCTLCGKEAKVPFEPIPGRPVYCPECYGKIGKGELKPVFSARVSQNNLTASASALSALGIEFAPVPGGGNSRAPQQQRQQLPKQKFSYTKPPEKQNHLQHDHLPHPLVPAGKQGLRDALKDFLKK